MEDAHATILNLDGKTGDEKASFFAVYDGHGGTSHALCWFSPEIDAVREQARRAGRSHLGPT